MNKIAEIETNRIMKIRIPGCLLYLEPSVIMFGIRIIKNTCALEVL